MTPFTDGYEVLHWTKHVQLDIFTFTGSFERIEESPNWIERDNEGKRLHRTTTKKAACSRDICCRAEANEHEPDCPVEQRLKDELGY